MIVDAFPFFNELDLLEIRLNELYETVDKFILIESTRTLSNKPKSLYFNENKLRFSRFLDKIDHIIINDELIKNLEWVSDRFTIDWYQKNYPLFHLRNYPDDTILCFSDLDEIVKAKCINNYNKNRGVGTFLLSNRCYYMNMIFNKCYYQPLKKAKISTLGWIRNSGKTLLEIRETISDYLIEDSGWHFSYLGGSEKIIEKIESFAHQEYNKEEIKDRKKIEYLISIGKDIYGRNYTYSVIPIDKNYPKFVLENFSLFLSKKYFLDEKQN